MPPSKERLDAFMVEAEALYRELHDEDDILDFDEDLEQILMIIVPHLIQISDKCHGDMPLDHVLAQFFGIIKIYCFDPDVQNSAREMG